MPRLRLSASYPAPVYHHDDGPTGEAWAWERGTERDVSDELAGVLLLVGYFRLVEPSVPNRAIDRASVVKAS